MGAALQVELGFGIRKKYTSLLGCNSKRWTFLIETTWRAQYFSPSVGGRRPFF